MKLGEIRRYIKQRGKTKPTEVATHFDISKEAAIFALDFWVKKGKIIIKGASCGSSCNGCGTSDETYQWVKKEQRIHWL